MSFRLYIHEQIWIYITFSPFCKRRINGLKTLDKIAPKTNKYLLIDFIAQI